MWSLSNLKLGHPMISLVFKPAFFMFSKENALFSVYLLSKLVPLYGLYKSYNTERRSSSFIGLKLIWGSSFTNSFFKSLSNRLKVRTISSSFFALKETVRYFSVIKLLEPATALRRISLAPSRRPL